MIILAERNNMILQDFIHELWDNIRNVLVILEYLDSHLFEMV